MPANPVLEDRQTRDRVLDLLRYQPRTVEELAAAVGLTPNGIRAQLAVLQRDGLVARHGVRHGAKPGKPPQLYGITAHAEAQFSAAYVPALAGLVAALGERLTPAELRSTFSAAGRRIAGVLSGSDRLGPAEMARGLLESLGAAATVRRDGTQTLVEGVACPLAEAVRHCPESCEMVRAMLAAKTGARVTTRCEHGASPRCRFGVK